jgi:hypothetical protein
MLTSASIGEFPIASSRMDFQLMDLVLDYLFRRRGAKLVSLSALLQGSPVVHDSRPALAFLLCFA